MSLLTSLFHRPTAPPPTENEDKELERFKLEMAEKRSEAKLERDRAARISEFLRCQQQGRDDCRVNISWEQLAEEGISGG